MDNKYNIKKNFLVPEVYIQKTAYCNKCNQRLLFTGSQLLSDPPQNVMICPNCKETFNISETELQGELRWRTI